MPEAWSRFHIGAASMYWDSVLCVGWSLHDVGLCRKYQLLIPDQLEVFYILISSTQDSGI